MLQNDIVCGFAVVNNGKHCVINGHCAVCREVVDEPTKDPNNELDELRNRLRDFSYEYEFDPHSPEDQESNEVAMREMIEFIDKKVTEALNKQLDEIGEPKLGDFDIEKESYDDVIKCIQWYKSAINQARAQLSKPKEEGENE